MGRRVFDETYIRLIWANSMREFYKNFTENLQKGEFQKAEFDMTYMCGYTCFMVDLDIISFPQNIKIAQNLHRIRKKFLVESGVLS